MILRTWKDVLRKDPSVRRRSGERRFSREFDVEPSGAEAQRPGDGHILRRLSDLYDFAPVGYLTLDARGSIREANFTAARLLGVKRAQLVNRPFALFVGKGGIRPFMAHLRRCKEFEKASTEIQLKVKGGGAVWADMTSTPVLEGGEFLLWTVIVDISKRKDAEDELKRHREHLDEIIEERTGEIKKINARLAEEVAAHEKAEDRIKGLNAELEGNLKRLEEVNRDLEAFNFSLAHDLSTPLRIIDGFTRMLTKYYSERLDDEGREFINTIQTNSARMTQLIADLLKLSRLGRAGLVKGRLDMTALARTVAEELKASLVGQGGQAGRKIIFKFHPLIPALGEETMIHQVFFNLIGNALKFTRPRDTAVIEVGGDTSDGDNVYYVRDNGVGFDMLNCERLFGLFRRLHTEREFEGNGAGLAIVSRIIERHGGKVWAEAKPDEGATFYFSLPAGREND